MKRMDQSLLHKVSLLDVHKLSLSYNLSLYRISREKKIIESYKNPREKLTKNTKLYTNLSLFSDQSLLAGPGEVFIGPR